MLSILIAVDDPRRPKRSSIISGPEVDPETTRRKALEFRSSKSNPSGLPWVLHIRQEGPEVISTPDKPQTKGTK